jgi:hypothetical protein
LLLLLLLMMLVVVFLLAVATLFFFFSFFSSLLFFSFSCLFSLPHPPLQQVLKQFAEYVEYGKEENAGIAEKRKALIKFSNGMAEADKPKYHCPECRRPIQQNEKLCRVCGARMPKKGVEPTPPEDILPDGTRAPN